MIHDTSTDVYYLHAESMRKDAEEISRFGLTGWTDAMIL